MADKKRAMITVKAQQWDRMQKLLEEKGFFPGTMSRYISDCVDILEDYLLYGKDNSQMVLFRLMELSELEERRNAGAK